MKENKLKNATAFPNSKLNIKESKLKNAN